MVINVRGWKGRGEMLFKLVLVISFIITVVVLTSCFLFGFKTVSTAFSIFMVALVVLLVVLVTKKR